MVGDYDIEKESTLQLLLRLRGSGDGPTGSTAVENKAFLSQLRAETVEPLVTTMLQQHVAMTELNKGETR